MVTVKALTDGIICRPHRRNAIELTFHSWLNEKKGTMFFLHFVSYFARCTMLSDRIIGSCFYDITNGLVLEVTPWKINAARCRYGGVQCNLILHTAQQWPTQNSYETHKSHPYLVLTASCEYIVRIVGKIARVITATHCIQHAISM